MPVSIPRDSSRFAKEWLGVVVVGVLALMACAKVGEDVLHHETAGFDSAVRAWALSHQSPVAHSFFEWISTVGSVTPMVLYAVSGALLLWRAGRPHVASGVLLAPAVAVATYLHVKKIFGRARPSIAGLLEGTSSFPSAHATTSAAITFTLAYVFWREDQVTGKQALAAAVLVPGLIGTSRVYLDMHWATDVLGGWSAGLLIAVMSAILYRRLCRHAAQGYQSVQSSRSRAHA